MNGMIVVLCGPSGAGKGCVFQEISSRRSNVKRIPSVTSREIREDDVPGTTYTFVKKEEFEDMISKNMFFESVLFDSNYYGTLRIPEEELSEFDIFFDKDVRGAIKIKETYPEAICIYIMPKDLETLVNRRGNRGKDRQKIAMEEVEIAKTMDFLVINDDIKDTADQIENIINCMRQNSMKNKLSIKFMDEFYK